MTAHDGARADVRKRHEAEDATPAIDQRPPSPNPDPSATATPVGPQIGSYAIVGDYSALMERMRTERPTLSVGDALLETTAERDALLAELDRLTAALAAERARVAELAKVEQWMADCALKAWSSATARHGCSDEEALIQHADTLSRWSERLRQSLTTTPAPTTESKEDDHA